jgi:polysaccharide pyruvyl transferase WcaK-like protein
MRILIVGQFGVNNFGDELFTNIIPSSLGKLEGDSIILCTHNKNISTINARNIDVFFQSIWMPISILGRLKEINKIDFALVGGGGLINDVYTPYSIYNLFALLATLKLLNKNYAFHGLEIGTVKSRFLRYLSKLLLKEAQFVHVRDNKSYERLKNLEIGHLILGTDLTHAFLRRTFFLEPSKVNTKKIAVVNSQHAHIFFVEDFKSVLLDLYSQGYHILFTLVGESAIQEVRSFIEKNNLQALYENCDFVNPASVDENIAIMRNADLYVTEKYHYTLSAFHSNKPVYVLLCVTKVKEFINDVERAAPSIIEYVSPHVVKINSNQLESRDALSLKLSSDTERYYNDLRGLIQKDIKREKKINVFHLICVIIFSTFSKVISFLRHRVYGLEKTIDKRNL